MPEGVIDWGARDKYIWSYMFAACGEGTCGGMGQEDTYEEAFEEIRYWVERGYYRCWITGPDGEVVFECEGRDR